MDEETDPTRTKTSPPVHYLPPRNTDATIRATEIGAILAKLALHYWRPDFDPAQAKHLLADFLSDLQGYSPQDIAAACGTYRRNPENKFFPTPGKLLEILREDAPLPSLPVYRPPQLTHDFRPATKSVGQILREHGLPDWRRSRS